MGCKKEMAMVEDRLRVQITMSEMYILFFLIASSSLRPLLEGVEDQETRAFLAPLIGESAGGSKLLKIAPTAYLSKPFEPLSVREIEVLILIARGSSNQEIAKRLKVSLSSVKTYVRRIYAKLDVNSRTKAVHVARNMGLLKEG